MAGGTIGMSIMKISWHQFKVYQFPRAVKDWTLEIGSAWTGPWSPIASGTLQSPFPLKANNQLPVPLVVTQFDSTMAQVVLHFQENYHL